ncbi:hypothetical protein ACFPMG_18890 [Azospirillum himalayense]|uniref:Uncharacterized protein n=2 Tax=Azospirillum himalayense TaxID=654847 RepID=A0ABW0G7P8_9PROT
MQGVRVGRFIVMTDEDGLRHAVKLGTVLAVSDRDECQDETVLQLPGGRAVTVRASLDEVLTWLDGPR